VTYAKIIADSISEQGHRVTTMEVRFHRFVLAEFNTHRVFSRNSASSRAIPVQKQMDMVTNDPAIPVSWPAEKSGMQGGDEIDTPWHAKQVWDGARADALFHAQRLTNKSLHKSVTNRLLEPFMWHTVVVTSSDWSGFFEQRCSPLAQPEIRVAAERMRDALEASEPRPLKEGQWHMPYIDPDTYAEIDSANHGDPSSLLVKISAARCARVSYLTHDGKRDLAKDLELYDRLVSAQPAHFSPLEHVATPWADNVLQHSSWFNDVDGGSRYIHRRSPRFGNLLGWRQLRLEVESEPGLPGVDNQSQSM
jgi:hypothetical protein